MLNCQLTPNHAGLSVWGDYIALRRLHSIIHEVVDQSSYIEDKEGFVLGLAFDIRKAYEKQRGEDYHDSSGGDRIKVYGVEILLPLLLTQCGVLRHAMAFIPTNKLHQAVMFELEYVVEEALRTVIPGSAADIIRRVRLLGSGPYQHISSVLDSRCRYFIDLAPEQRLNALPVLMDTFDPMYGHVQHAYTRSGRPTITPESFADSEEEWPEFAW